MNKIFSIEGELSSLTPEDRKKQRIIREQSELEAFWLWAKKNAVSSSKKFVALVLLVKGVIVESIESDIPEDLVQIFKVLGDKTRLRIIKLMSESELYDAALKNTKSFMKPRMIRMRALGMCAPMDNDAYCVMGNNSAKNCAALIADPEYLQEIAEMIGTDYYIVPLGIEGFVVVPEAYCDVDMQKDALKGTNEASQKDKLFLPNDLYFYGSETGELSVVQ